MSDAGIASAVSRAAFASLLNPSTNTGLTDGNANEGRVWTGRARVRAFTSSAVSVLPVGARVATCSAFSSRAKLCRSLLPTFGTLANLSASVVKLKPPGGGESSASGEKDGWDLMDAADVDEDAMVDDCSFLEDERIGDVKSVVDADEEVGANRDCCFSVVVSARESPNNEELEEDASLPKMPDVAEALLPKIDDDDEGSRPPPKIDVVAGAASFPKIEGEPKAEDPALAIELLAENALGDCDGAENALGLPSPMPFDLGAFSSEETLCFLGGLPPSSSSETSTISTFLPFLGDDPLSSGVPRAEKEVEGSGMVEGVGERRGDRRLFKPSSADVEAGGLARFEPCIPEDISSGDQEVRKRSYLGDARFDELLSANSTVTPGFHHSYFLLLLLARLCFVLLRSLWYRYRDARALSFSVCGKRVLVGISNFLATFPLIVIKGRYK